MNAKPTAFRSAPSKAKGATHASNGQPGRLPWACAKHGLRSAMRRAVPKTGRLLVRQHRAAGRRPALRGVPPSSEETDSSSYSFRVLATLYDLYTSNPQLHGCTFRAWNTLDWKLRYSK